MIIKEPSNRIEILDGFRFIAILSVILYHYFSLWTIPIQPTSLYPYEDRFNYFSLGYLGVEFFFIISGFVIASSLQTSSSISGFLKKRIIRLFPAMLICSLITFFIFARLDSENIFPRSKDPVNLAYSLTFINPELLNILLKPFGIHGRNLCGSYWSLWPEIQFYFLAAFIYFLNPAKFFIRFVLTALILTGINILVGNLFDTSSENYFVVSYFKLSELFNLIKFILWFTAGILFYQLYTKTTSYYTWSGLLLVYLFILYECSSWQIRGIASLMFVLFFIFIFAPRYLKFLKTRAIASVGLASYSLYLIHEQIGVLFINKYAGSWAQLSGIFSLLLIFVFVIFSQLLYRFVEKPLNTYLKSRLISKTRSSKNLKPR